MSTGIVEPITTEVVFDTYAGCHAALFARDLSRTFDKRSYEGGNVRAGIVSTSHGVVHRNRRRLENQLFRAERLELYERTLFPGVVDRLLDRLVMGGRADLFVLGEMLSVVLAATRAGIDHDPDSVEELRQLVDLVNDFSQGSAIVDARGDVDALRQQVREAQAEFDRRYVRPSRRRREELIAQVESGAVPESELPNDVLTLLLLHRDDPAYGFDDGLIVRETATYLQGGTHTSSQTLINTIDLLSSSDVADAWERIEEDRLFAQRCIHEALRLRPTTPRIKRRAEADTEVAGRQIPEGALVVLDAAAANRDPEVFGADADRYDPDRTVPDRVPRWGLSFGAGPHQCPGRNVAGGFPIPDRFEVDDDHLFGLVAAMLQAVVRLGIRPDPAGGAERDTRTERWTRWSRYPVVFQPEGV